MKGATHLAYGVLTGTLYAVNFATDLNSAILTVALSSFGSLIPDIDSKTSTISNLLVMPKFLPLKHRGFCHSATLATVVTIINQPLGIGMFSHIILDLLNYRKIKLFAPFSDKKFALKLCKSDGVVDEILRLTGIGALIFILIV